MSINCRMIHAIHAIHVIHVKHECLEGIWIWCISLSEGSRYHTRNKTLKTFVVYSLAWVTMRTITIRITVWHVHFPWRQTNSFHSGYNISSTKSLGVKIIHKNNRLLVLQIIHSLNCNLNKCYNDHKTNHNCCIQFSVM